MSSVGKLLDDDAVRIANGLRPICQPHNGRRGKTVDELGTNGLKCRFSAGRHAALKETVKRATGSDLASFEFWPRVRVELNFSRPS